MLVHGFESIFQGILESIFPVYYGTSRGITTEHTVEQSGNA